MYRIGRKHIISTILTTAAAACTLLSGIVPAKAQDLLAQSVVVFSGSPSRIEGFTVGDWGSGTSVFTSEMKYNDKQSLKITTKDLGEGARIDIKDPVDLTKAFANPNSFLQLALNFGSPSAGRSLLSGNSVGHNGGMGMGRGMGMGMGMGTGMGRTSGPGGQVKNTRPNYIRLMLVLSSGEMLEARAPVAAFGGAATGWMNVNFPLPILKKNLNIEHYLVKRVIVSGDGNGSFYLGEIHTIEDSSSLKAYGGESREVSRLDTVKFEATQNSSATPVRYTWDFGESKTGLCEDAVGRTVQHKFRTKGDYTVTLTVSDFFGLKAPATSTLKVRVRPLLSDHSRP
jgi:hypothetical protein